MHERQKTNRLRTGGAVVFSGRLSAVRFLSLIFPFSLSKRQELELAQIVG